MSDIFISIANYNFNDNAEKLKKIFSTKFDTILIDSSSDTQPKTTDVVICNKFYPGLWNESVRLSIEENYEWLFFIASDVNFIYPEIDEIHNIVCNIIDDPTIGVYSPSIDKKSRCSFKQNFCQHSKNIRTVDFVEGFIFLARTSILKCIYPVDYTFNKYGWSLDVIMSDVGRYMNFKTVIDDRICVYHPQTKIRIDSVLALKQGLNHRKHIEQQLIENNNDKIPNQ